MCMYRMLDTYSDCLTLSQRNRKYNFMTVPCRLCVLFFITPFPPSENNNELKMRDDGRLGRGRLGIGRRCVERKITTKKIEFDLPVTNLIFLIFEIINV